MFRTTGRGNSETSNYRFSVNEIAVLVEENARHDEPRCVFVELTVALGKIGRVWRALLKLQCQQEISSYWGPIKCIQNVLYERIFTAKQIQANSQEY